MNAASLARSFRFLLLCAAASAAAIAAQACGDDGGSYTVLDDDAGPRGDRPDAFTGGRDGEAPLATLRLAHLARDLGAIDFCYQAARAGAFEGPVLRTGGVAQDASVDAPPGDGGLEIDADLLDGGDDASTEDAGASAALAYGSVSKYLTVAATGTIVVVIVPAGATSCGGAIATGTVTLDPGKLSTVAVFSGAGEDAGAAVAAFTDDRETKADKARVRIIHGAAGGPFAVQISGAQTTPVASEVVPRRASSASSTIPVDALGFATIVPVAPPASIVVTPASDAGDAGADPWQSEAREDLDLRGDSLHTAFVVGEPGAFEVLWCADKNTTGDRTTCTLVR